MRLLMLFFKHGNECCCYLASSPFQELILMILISPRRVMNKQNNRKHVPVMDTFAGSDMFCSNRFSFASRDMHELVFIPQELINHLISLIGPNQN